MDLKDRRVLVLGLGISGRSAANFCAARGAVVCAADEAPHEKLSGLDELADDVELRVGAALPDAADFDVVIPSPGVPQARYAGARGEVLGDIELAARFLEVPIVAITGTNGKSTVVTLVEAMLNAGGLRAHMAGNVGTPVLSLVGAPLDVAVLEVSSFQLEAVASFAPRVAAVLNVTPDHLDRHGDMQAYAAAKARIFANQVQDYVAILNFDDPATVSMADDCNANLRYFSVRGPVPRGVCVDGGALAVIEADRMQRVGLEDTPYTRGHALANLLASVAIVRALGIDAATAVAAACDVAPLPHRCETVGTLKGVTFVNDSKATNPGAAARSLEGFDAPIHWLAGGSDKGVAFDDLAATAEGRVRRAYLYGETASALAASIGERFEVERCESLEQAVVSSAARARGGEVVLLAPACASFDQFENFEARGDAFRSAVRALPSGATTRTVTRGETA